MSGVHCSRRGGLGRLVSVLALPRGVGLGDTMESLKHAEPDMNPMPTIDILALYGQRIHAGGWPKLGWCRMEQDDDA